MQIASGENNSKDIYVLASLTASRFVFHMNFFHVRARGKTDIWLRVLQTNEKHGYIYIYTIATNLSRNINLACIE